MVSNRSPLLVSLAMGVFLAVWAWGMATSLAESDSKKIEIEGAWMGTLTPTNQPFPPFTNLITFIPKGGVVESHRLYVPQTIFGVPLLATAGHGAWKKVGAREFQINFVSLLQGAPDPENANQGMELGIDNFSLSAKLNREGTELSGSFQNDVRDLDGTVVLTIIGTYNATRIRAEP
jgi:hypothetical protein